MEENEGLESGSTDAGSEGSSTSTSTESTAAPLAAAQEGAVAVDATKQQQDVNTPFHEHPRFKELVEQKNQAQAQQRAYEQRMAQLESQLRSIQTAPKGPDERAELLQRLKGIDPAFGKLIEELAPTGKELQEMREWRQQMETQQVRTQAIASVNDLHSQNKVDGTIKDLINGELEAMDARGLIKGVQDIPRAYKEVHDRMNKYAEAIKRDATAAYTKGKTQDAKVPTSQPKGAPVKSTGKGFQYNTRDREAGLAQVVSQYIQSKNSSNDF